MIPQRIYGWRKQNPDQRDYLFEPTLSAQAVPDLVDLRPDFQALLIFDQGKLGSCTAHSVAAALWHSEGIKRNQLSALVPSRLFIYYNERLIEKTVRSDSGATVRDSLKAVATYGACCEAEWPYDITKFTKKPAKAQYASALLEERVLTYEAVPQNLTAMQVALAGKFPICIGFSVYNSFESDAVAKSGLVPLPKRSESMLGGHAVLVVGYDNEKKVFIVRNSWGTTWGDQGYFYLPYAYVLNPQLASDFWVIRNV